MTDWPKIHIVRWWQNIGCEFYDSEGQLLSSVTDDYTSRDLKYLDDRCLKEGLTTRTAQTSPDTGNAEYFQWVRPERHSDIEPRTAIDWTRLVHMRPLPASGAGHRDTIPELPRADDPLPDYSEMPETLTAWQVLDILVAHPKARPMMPQPNSGAFTPIAELYKILQEAGLLDPDDQGNHVLSKAGLAYIRDLASNRASVPNVGDLVKNRASVPNVGDAT